MPRIPRGLKQAAAKIFKTESTSISAPVDETVRFHTLDYHRTIDANIEALLDAARLRKDGYVIRAPIGDDTVDFRGEYEAHEKHEFEVLDQRGRVIYEGTATNHLMFIKPIAVRAMDEGTQDEATLVDMEIEVHKPQKKTFGFIENYSGKVWHGYGDTKAEAWRSLAENYIESLELNHKEGIPRKDWVSYTQDDFSEVSE